MSKHNYKFYLEMTGQTLRGVGVSQTDRQSSLEQFLEVSLDQEEDLRCALEKAFGFKAGSYLPAFCGIYPADRLLRNAAIKEAALPLNHKLMEEIVSGQFRINPQNYTIAALNADDGLPVETGRLYRNLFFCGAPHEELKKAQDLWIEAGVYPLRMELASAATLGMLLSWTQVEQLVDAVLVLELGANNSHSFIINNGRLDASRHLPLGLNSMISNAGEELGLKDAESARRLFFSDSFDFTEMGPRLIEKMLRELQSLIGLYEVQTGHAIGRVICTMLPGKLFWLNRAFATCLGMSAWHPDYPRQLEAMGMKINQQTFTAELDGCLLGLLSLMHKEEQSQ